MVDIGAWALYDCWEVASISIPASVISITANPFAYSALTDIAVSPDNPSYEQVDGVLFLKEPRTLVAYPIARQGAYVIPEGVKAIRFYAFAWCVNLTGVTLPEGLESIDDGAFYGCMSLTRVDIPDGVRSMGEGAFYACEGLISADIPESVTNIGDSAFEWCDDVVLSVAKGSKAEKYALREDIAYGYRD